MSISVLLVFMGFEKTPPRSQTQKLKGVKIAKNNCNPHAFDVFSIVVNLENSNEFPEKRLSLPNKRPNEF